MCLCLKRDTIIYADIVLSSLLVFFLWHKVNYEGLDHHEQHQGADDHPHHGDDDGGQGVVNLLHCTEEPNKATQGFYNMTNYKGKLE